MMLPTEQVGSIPRPAALIQRIRGFEARGISQPDSSYGIGNLAPDRMPISFADGHIRKFPRITARPFSYKTPADVYLEIAQKYAHVPLKQAVISASALSLLYPQGGIPGYSREQYLDFLIAEQEGEIRRCLQKDAHVVQMDPRGRLWQATNGEEGATVQFTLPTDEGGQQV